MVVVWNACEHFQKQVKVASAKFLVLKDVPFSLPTAANFVIAKAATQSTL